MNPIPVDRVLVSSTVYDQNDFRLLLVRELRQLEFDAYVFDQAPIPPDVDAQSSDQCLDLVDDADCVIGIIGKRHGNPYRGTKRQELFAKIDAPKDLSITQAEILYAMELKKPTIKLLRGDVWNGRHIAKTNPDAKGVLAPGIVSFLDFLNRRETDNWVHTEVASLDDAISIISAALLPKRRLGLLGNAMVGPDWNGKNYFCNHEVTVVNKMADAHSAILDLRCLDGMSNNIDRLKWLVGLLAPLNMTLGEKDFLVRYILEYTRAITESDLHSAMLRENRAIALLERLRFGDNSVFGGYQHSQNGGQPIELSWPENANRWSPHGRIEFILYSLQMEEHVPIDLRRMMEFSTGTKSDTGQGFEAHYSRKPVTVGCQSACKVRLRKHNGTRGIELHEEMKSLIYVAQLGERFCLVAAHGEGDKFVDEEIVVERLQQEFHVDSLLTVDPESLLEYLQKITCPTPNGSIYSGRRLSFDGAQQMISLYASAINPVSIFKSVEFKYGYIESACSLSDGFDVLMLWDQGILSAEHCYNNAGSPTFGVRFKPKAMFDHVRMNAELLKKRMGHIGRFIIGDGAFFIGKEPKRAS